MVIRENIELIISINCLPVILNALWDNKIKQSQLSEPPKAQDFLWVYSIRDHLPICEQALHKSLPAY